MIAYVKLAILLIAFAGTLAMSNGARQLLDAYDGCYNGWQSWHNGGCRDSYYCNNYQWRCDGSYWNGHQWYGPGNRGGFCIGLCG